MKNKPLQIIFIIISLIIFSVAHSQEKNNTITGLITDSLTKQPLPNATVYLISNTTNEHNNTTAAINGSFVITNILSGSYQLKIEYVGYNDFIKNDIVITDEKKTITIENIQLSAKKGILENVTVTSSAVKPFISQSAGSIILNVAQSPIASTSNAYDILLRAPGVIDQDGLRFRMKTVTILIDGKPTNLSQEDLKNMLSDMPGSSIDKVEIIPNPSAKYDAQGGSVINIKLAKNKKYGTSGTLLAGVGEGRYGRYSLGGTANYKNKNINIYSSYDFDHNRQYTDISSNRILSTYSNVIQNEHDVLDKNNHSFKIGADYDINKNNVIGVLLKGYSTTQNRDFTNHSMLTNNITNNDTSSSVFTKGSSQIFNPSLNIYYKTIFDSLGRELTVNIDYFNYQKKWNDNLTSAYYDQTDKQYLPNYLLRDYSPANNNTTSVSVDYSHPSKIGNFEAGIKGLFTTADNNILWQGLTINDWITDNTKTNHFIYNENVLAAYLTYDKAFSQKWELNVGVRAEQTITKGNLVNTGEVNKRDYLNIFPNLSLQYIRNLNNLFSFSYRKSIDRFGFDIVNPFIKFQSQYSYYRGNPNIQPQISHSIDFNYSYKQAWNFGTSETHIINALGPVFLKSGSNVTISSYTNFKSADLFYVYGMHSKEVIKGWTTIFIDGFGFYKYDTSSDSVLQQTPNNTWSYQLQWNNIFNLKKGWSGEWNNFYQGPLASGIYKLGAIFHSDLGISKQVLKSQAYIKLAVTDIFNTQKSNAQINYGGVVMSQLRKVESRVLSLNFIYKFGNKNVKAKKERDSQLDDIKSRTNY